VPSPLPDFSAFLERFVDDELRQRVDRMGLAVNEFGYDRWGGSPASAMRMLVIVRWLYRNYFRVETSGLEHLPAGRVMVVGNHSAQLAYDGMLVAAAVALDAEPPRMLRAMIEHFFANVPLVSIVMTRVGQLTGTPENAERLLAEEDAAIMVFPEGHRGGGRVWRDRYKMMGFGQGFMRLALKTDTPIVPFGFIGGEEMCASLSRMEPLAKLMGTPYTPLSPTILPLPLPVKAYIHFGKPMHFEGAGDDEDEVIAVKVRKVEKAVARLIAKGLKKRRSIFFG
jgi:1-acyl-sn-glycerol-3-phosphate acyltransferase